jgi:hypothetical protein
LPPALALIESPTRSADRLRCELELRACSIVLDLLALALIDRADVDAIVGVSIEARLASRRLAPPAGAQRVGDIAAAEGSPDALEAAAVRWASMPAQALVRIAERELQV